MRILLVPILLLSLVLTGCANGPGVRSAARVLDQTAVSDSLAFALTLDAFSALSDSSRMAAQQAAQEITSSWRDFEGEAKVAADSEFDHLAYRDDPPHFNFLGFGLGNSLLDLKKATKLDPSFAEGWAAMGALSTQVGDVLSAQNYLNHAQAAADASSTPLDPVIQLQIFRDRAWVLRDLALWEKGLDLVDQGLDFRHGDPDLMLVKGLLLAGAGRYSEAISLAVRMKPVEYPQYDFIYRGLKTQTSAYANNWIRAMALLAVGDVDLAYAKIGDLDLYMYRGRLPHSARFWRDAGLLAELAGDPNAPLYYAVGFVTRPYKYFYPASANNITPQVLDIPSSNLPVFTSFGPRFYLGGSPFTYVGMQINMMVAGLFSQQRSAAAGRALQMLDLLERRHIRPDICHALRGRIYFANEDFQLATQELTLAQEAFRADDETDAPTSLFLGLLAMRDKQYSAAQKHFLESVTADSTSALTWRSLAVSSAKLGQQDRAGRAMDRAVELDPWNVSGLYNRGLFRLQNGKLGPATADLQRALSIDPENHEVQHVGDLILTTARHAGADSAYIEAVAMGTPMGETANPAQLLANLQSEIDGMFTVPDSLRVSDAESEERISTLMNRYMLSRDPVTRAVLALALIDHSKFIEAQSLLAPGWGVDLSPDEELMLLYVDHQIGEQRRAEQVIQTVLRGNLGRENPYHIVQAANVIRNSTDPVATDPVSPNTHGFFGWWRDSKHSYGTIVGRSKFIQDLDLFRGYAGDRLFDQAVWGMSQTPITGTGYGVGKNSGAKR